MVVAETVRNWTQLESFPESLAPQLAFDPRGTVVGIGIRDVHLRVVGKVTHTAVRRFTVGSSKL
jgi:hypothetical protein